MAEKIFGELKCPYINLVLLVVLVFLAGHASLLYWQKLLSFGHLTFWILGLVLIGALFVFGTRIVHKDGFVDGFKNGFKNGFQNGRDGAKPVEKSS